MKRRIVAFGIVWAYLANILWHLHAVPETYASVYLLPPGYFFVVGFLLGALNESLSTYWPRIWVTPAVLGVGLELSIWLYGGTTAGIPLGVLFALVTLIASSSACYLARFRKLPLLVGLLSGLSILAWLLSPWCTDDHNRQEMVSPGGAFIAWKDRTSDEPSHYVHVGPRFGWNGAFGKMVLVHWPDHINSEDNSGIHSLHWITPATLKIAGLDEESYHSPSALLPVEVIVSKE